MYSTGRLAVGKCQFWLRAANGDQDLPRQPVQAAPAVRAGRRSAGGHREAGRGRRRRPGLPDPARGDRIGQDLHHGQRDRAPRPAGDGAWRRTRRWRRSCIRRCASSFPRTRSSISFPTTTTTSPRPTCLRATCSSRRIRASTSTSSRCACRRPSRCWSGEDAVIVATVSAIYGIGDPVDYHGMILHLRESEKMSQRDVIARLMAMQYERNEIDSARGTFRVRGDVIDIFPAEHAEHAMRVSLFDDEVEKLCRCSTRSPAGCCSRCRASPSIPPAITSRRARPRCARSRQSRSSCASASNISRKRASWSRRSASSSALASTWRCSPRWASARASRTIRATCPGASRASRRRR